MLIAIALLKALVEIAGLALIGQGILHVLAGANREQNFFYRVLRLIASPAWKLARLITPRFIADSHIGWAALFLCAGLWIGLSIEKLQQCRVQPDHPLCEQYPAPPAR